MACHIYWHDLSLSAYTAARPGKTSRSEPANVSDRCAYHALSDNRGEGRQVTMLRGCRSLDPITRSHGRARRRMSPIGLGPPTFAFSRSTNRGSPGLRYRGSATGRRKPKTDRTMHGVDRWYQRGDIRSPMTAAEKALVQALAKCRFRASSSADGRFCRDLAKMVRERKRFALTKGQSAYLWRIGDRYRLQLPPELFGLVEGLTNAARLAAGMHRQERPKDRPEHAHPG